MKYRKHYRGINFILHICVLIFNTSFMEVAWTYYGIWLEDWFPAFLLIWLIGLFAIPFIVYNFTPTVLQIQNITKDVIAWIVRTEAEKDSLKQSFDTFIELAKSDFSDSEIDAVRIAEVTDTIRSIMLSVEKLNECLNSYTRDIRKNRQNSKKVSTTKFNRILRYHEGAIKTYVTYQKDWLSKAVPVFTKGIQAYLKYHNAELNALSLKLKKQKSSTDIASQ